MAQDTQNSYFSKPSVGGDTDTWGTTLNANWDTVDSVLAGDDEIIALAIGTTSSSIPLTCNAASATNIAASFSGYVGIGTDSPTYNLVVNNAASSAIQIRSGNDDAGHLYFADTDDDNIGGVSYSHEYNFMNFKTSDTERMRIDSNGKVGIGTSSPDQKLQVDGNIRLGDTASGVDDDEDYGLITGGQLTIHANDSGDNVNYTGLVFDVGNASGAQAASSRVIFKVNNTERMRIAASGNVGIGTDSPASRLHVRQPSGTQGFLQSRGTEYSSATFEISTDSSKTRLNSYGDGLTFWTAELSGTTAERMRIDSSGKVGIGTTSPDALLHVGTNTKSSATKVKIENADGYAPTLEFNQSGTGAASISVPADTNALQFNRFNGSTLSESMRIDSSGKLGIGTTSPSSRLHVAGDGKFDGGTSTVLDVLCDDGGTADIKALGDNQGNGRVYVGQSNTYGGGIEYCGNDDPALSGAGSDKIALFRRHDGTNEWTAKNSYNSNDWEFRGKVTAASAVINGDLTIPSKIIHNGDTNTYMQFHATDQWRVVTNGYERLEVNNSAVTTSTQFVGKGAIAYTDVSFYSSGDNDQTVTFSIPSGHAVINALITTSGFNYNAIKNLKNTSCEVDRYNEESDQTVNLRVWHSKV